MKYLAVFLLLIPSISFAQKTENDYAIYSQYLKIYTANKKVTKINFAIRESTDYSQKDDSSDINDLVGVLRGNINGDRASISSLYIMCKEFPPILKQDTLWIPLIIELGKKMKKTFIIKNEFSTDLQTSILSKNGYDKYFRNNKHIDKNWKKFNQDFPRPVALIELSEIASDGQRAAFYFSSRCGGLCGEGSVVLFYKEGTEWKYLQTLHIWYS